MAGALDQPGPRACGSVGGESGYRIAGDLLLGTHDRQGRLAGGRGALRQRLLAGVVLEGVVDGKSVA
jgi:hypothetical protein